MSQLRKWILCLSAMSYVFNFAVEGAREVRQSSNYVAQKCCAKDEYYNLNSQQCVSGGSNDNFESIIRPLLVKGNVRDIRYVYGRVLKCPNTGDCPETSLITSQATHSLLTNGRVSENFHGVTYDLKNYCLEAAGTNNQDLSLTIASCTPSSNVLPKCCPDNHYFDSINLDCVQYPANDNSERDLKSIYSRRQMRLQYKNELQCSTTIPVQFKFPNGANVDKCNNICVNSPKQCYSIRKFCIDMIFTESLEHSAFVCADNITKKCCK